VRIGLFVDAAFRRGGPEGKRVYSGDELLGFGRFAAAVGERVGTLVLIARSTEDTEGTPYELPAGVELAGLPHYRSLRDIAGVVRAIPGTVAGMWRALGAVDAVWVSAANPIGVILMGLAGLRRRPIVVLARQDSMNYYRSRLPSRLWTPLLAPLALVDWIYRAVARRARATVVGSQVGRRYGAPRDNVLEITVSLIERDRIPRELPERAWGQPVRLLTVGRIEPEKNPALLAEALAVLECERPGGFVATWAGKGRLSEDLMAAARRLGVSERLELPGFVPFGPALFALYEGADALLHIAATEGVPGVLSEAMACGLPIIATDVGGIRTAAAGGTAALLVRPDDAHALAEGVLTLDADPGLRTRLAEAGLVLARERSLEAEVGRVAGFIAAGD
jgi:glycosyltransferase involved in cell wall biosynthesis